MKSIIRVTLEDGQFGYVQRTDPQIETTTDITQAMKMEWSDTLQTALALGTLKIAHAIITKATWDD